MRSAAVVFPDAGSPPITRTLGDSIARLIDHRPSRETGQHRLDHGLVCPVARVATAFIRLAPGSPVVSRVMLNIERRFPGLRPAILRSPRTPGPLVRPVLAGSSRQRPEASYG